MTTRNWLVASVLLAVATTAVADGQLRYNFIPRTISPEAQKTLQAIYDAKAYARVFPAADDLTGWRTTHAGGEQGKVDICKKAVADNKVTVIETRLGGVPVLDIRPEGWKDNGKVLVYTHGGAYTMFSARSTLNSSAPMSRATGLRVISIDYTTAPFAKWKEIQEQVISVFKALLAQGYTMEDIALYGDSAGGGLATSTVLNLRDRGMGMPAAVALLSPWVDISDAGDTQHTLTYTDPLLHYDPLLKTSAQAFADGLDLADPRVSPLYGDFSKGFSPAIITEGTKCTFLSTSVRLFQALEAAGQDAKLDVYEGMWHVFQTAPSPETEVSLKKIATFLHRHLGAKTVLANSLAASAFADEMPTDPRGGKPAKGSKPSVEDLDDQVKYQRAFEAVIWSMSAVSGYQLYRAAMENGAEPNTVMAFSKPATPKAEFLTANNVTPYILSQTDLRQGPVVIEVPKSTDKAGLFGQIVDHWQITIADIGPVGVDKGKGAKILLTPPGYDKPIPAGYIEIKSPSYRIVLVFRSIPSPKASKDVPAERFWSLTVYDRETFAFIYSKEGRVGLSSRELDKMKLNADGSVTLYVGPKSPEGLKSNWIPTSGKPPYLCFRLYGPTDPLFDRSFKLPDANLME